MEPHGIRKTNTNLGKAGLQGSDRMKEKTLQEDSSGRLLRNNLNRFEDRELSEINWWGWDLRDGEAISSG